MNQPLPAAPEDETLKAEAQDVPPIDVVLRASISLRGHLVAALQVTRDMATAAKRGDMKMLQSFAYDAEALIAENQMLGMSIENIPSMPPLDVPLTLSALETIFGVQRTRIAAREVNRAKK